jgi:hypothetical protein
MPGSQSVTMTRKRCKSIGIVSDNPCCNAGNPTPSNEVVCTEADICLRHPHMAGWLAPGVSPPRSRHEGIRRVMDDGSAQPGDAKSDRSDRAGELRPRRERFRRRDAIAHVRIHHPGCSSAVRKAVAERICRRSWTEGTALGAAVGITLENFARHERTEYDTLLKQFRLERDEARLAVRTELRDLLESWRRKDSQ